MLNKYWYSFLKDPVFRTVCLASIVSVVSFLVLIRLNMMQSLEINDIQNKQAIIAQIPDLQAKIGQTKVIVKGISLTLNGIISDKGQPVAVINNTFLKIGDKVEGKILTTITTDSVMLCDTGSADKCVKLFLQ